MTAAELAHFRSLLQSQAGLSKPPARSLFERMRGRLTLVEPSGAPPSAEAAGRERPSAPASLTWEEVLAPAAPPPPRSPRTFGRREGEAAPLLSLVPDVRAADETGPDVAITLRRSVGNPEEFATPDEAASAVPSSDADAPASARPSPGVIAGWSRKRPPSAQRRILARLEAVFLAEQQGLDARRGALETSGTEESAPSAPGFVAAQHRPA